MSLFLMFVCYSPLATDIIAGAIVGLISYALSEWNYCIEGKMRSLFAGKHQLMSVRPPVLKQEAVCRFD